MTYRKGGTGGEDPSDHKVIGESEEQRVNGIDAAATSTEKILLVDDEEAVLETLRSILELEGYDVCTAFSGEAALKEMERTSFDLILTDLKMKGISGLDVLLQAEKLWPRPVTILLTGYASLESAVEALNLGAYAYLVKPFGIEGLKTSIRQGLEKRRLSEVEVLYQIARTLISTLHLDAILDEVLNQATRLTGFSRSLFLLYKGKEIHPVSREKEADQSWISAVISLLQEDKEIGERLEKGEVILIPNAERGEGRPHPILSRLKTKTLLAVPVVYQGELGGVLYLDNRSATQSFTPRDFRLVVSLADLAALAIQNAGLFEELRRMNRSLRRTKLALEDANRELKTLDQMKTNLLSNVSHELKTPMVAVKGYTSLVLKGKAGPIAPLQKEYLDIALRNIHKQLELIDDLLDFSKLEIQEQVSPRERVDLTEVLNETLQLIRPKAEEKRISLSVQVEGGPWWVEIHKKKMGQVFDNLLSNAIKFTPEGGRITVGFKGQRNGKILISISDTGIGIPPEKQGKIFDRFYQVESSESRRYGGFGLGLAIAQDIVKAHGSKIKVVSRTGAGAEFNFSLRRA
ncbi:MAG: response regulator [Nitrospirae bacterium]|nr:response regulator [Candidatus Manganitrophaceae bacterium]